MTFSGSQFRIRLGPHIWTRTPFSLLKSFKSLSTPLGFDTPSTIPSAAKLLSKIKARFTADMTFPPIKVVRKRRLDTNRAKSQQETRRKRGLVKKAREYSLECGAYVYLAIKIKKNGRIFIFNSDSTGEWPLPEAQIVRHPFFERSLRY
jgi:hypothetical protein